MTTREHLGAITDAGKFESLAMAALRKIDPDCAAVIHHGVNSEGKTVKAPVDAWCLVPQSNPPRFVYIAATAISPAKLQEKWLFAHTAQTDSKRKSSADDGDVLKAACTAEQHRRDDNFINAQFRIILTTNQTVRSDLQTTVYSHCKRLALDPLIVEQTQLADFLDYDPNGQYLRKRFLGVEEELLSYELLLDIGKESCRAHAQEFVRIGAERSVVRTIDRTARDFLGAAEASLIFLSGRSGFGKSTTASSVLNDHLAAGRCGIWLPAQNVENSVTLDEALSRTFRALRPKLECAAANKIASLLPDLFPFLILVDDVNRSRDSTSILRKLRAWTSLSDSDTERARRNWRCIICPVWPELLTNQGADAVKSAEHSVISVESFTSDEAIAVIQTKLDHLGIEVADAEMRECAARLNHDPFLLGLLTQVVASDSKDLRSITDRIVERFLARTLQNIVVGGNEVISDFHNCLNGVARSMISLRALHPSWTELRALLATEGLRDAAEVLRKDGRLCHVTQEETFVFRHDRLQEHFLVNAMVGFLEANDEDVYSEPFFANIVGRALLRLPKGEAIIAKLIEKNPVALFEAIAEFGIAQTSLQTAIVDAATAWIKKDVVFDSAPRSIIYSVANKLMETQSPLVLEFTRYFEPFPAIQGAMFRNGNAWGGILYLARLGRADFPPAVKSPWWDDMVQIARTHHMPQLKEQLKALLSDAALAVENREGALLLAGYVGLTELAESVVTCWQSTTDKARILPHTLWALFHCCDEPLGPRLDPIFEFWCTLRGRPSNGEDLPPRHDRAVSLARGLRRPIRDDVVRYLISKRGAQSTLDSPIRTILHEIDSPSSVEIMVEDYAKSRRGGAATWDLHFLADRWDRSRHNGRNLSPQSRRRLQELWENTELDPATRSVAFEIWCWGATREELSLLQTIDNSSIFYRKAVHRRALLRDSSVERAVAENMRHEIWFASISHHVWGPILFEATDSMLGKLLSEGVTAFGDSRHIVDDILADLLSHIPARDATKLFIKHAEGLRTKPHFVQTAVFVGTPECMHIANESIRANMVPDVFEHLGIRACGLRGVVPNWCVEAFLKRIEVYLPQMKPDDAETLSWVCHTPETGEWMQSQLLKFLTPQDRRKVEWSDEAIAAQLDSFVGKDNDYTCVFILVDHAKRRGNRASRQILQVTVKWFRNNPGLLSYRILAHAIAQIGTRHDLNLLAETPSNGSAEDIRRIRASAEFEVKRRTLK